MCANFRRLVWILLMGAALPMSFSQGCKRPGKAQNRISHPRAATLPSAPKEATLDLGNTITLKLALIPAGQFLMGSSASNNPQSYDRAHPVTLTQPFYMGIYEVTQEQYEAVMGKNPSFFKGAQRPVEYVSWDDATAFCEKVSQRVGRTVRLPTEAEWEYACRAGRTTAFCFGDDEARLDEYAWRRGSPTRPVGQKKPNAWGLYDMHGNVEEWCGDWYVVYPATAQTDPTGPSKGQCRIIRGGAYGSSAEFCCSSHRNYNLSSTQEMDIGFRVVME